VVEMNFKQGDRVRVKTWEELLATPGAELDMRDIHLQTSSIVFVHEMKDWCGREIDLSKPNDGWNFADWMLTEAKVETKPTSEKDDGGPAFPSPEAAHPGAFPPSCPKGMSLRDYFAAKAMQGFAGENSQTIPSVTVIAEWSYNMADAMLEARMK